MSSVLRSIVGLWLLASAVFSLSQTVPNAKPFVPNNRWGLVIGVSGYAETVGPLHYTAKEAEEFSRSLRDDLGFAPENLRLLADGGQSDVAPTSANILAALDSLLSDKRLDKANLFVFYFSGHGVGTPNGDFLLPADAQKGEFETKGVPVREVIHRIVGAGLKNVLFIADACRAGTANDFGADLTELCHKANIAVILGCAPGRRSYEYPNLQQGAFTHFLLEGIRRPELRDASGALWASRLGADLQRRVHDFTEPDHGKFAQTPSLWGEESTLDVLLAAYPQPPVSDEAIRLFKSNAQRLGKEDYATALIAYAGDLYLKDRTDEAVEMLKTVEALGELTPEARYTLASALDTLGRTGEAARISVAFTTMPSGLYRNLAVATSVSREVGPAPRLRAAADLFGATDSWAIDQIAANTVDAWGNDAQRLAYAKRLATEGRTPRARLLGAAKVATLQGRWADALAATEEARATPGEGPSDLVLYLERLVPLKAQGDARALDRFYDGAIALGSPGFAHIGKAKLAKDRGDPAGRVSELKAALAVLLDPQEILLALTVAGPYVANLAPDFKAAALRHPYSWRARVALYIVRRIQGDDSVREADALAADRYMDDPVAFYATLFETMESILAEATQMGRVPPGVYRAQIDGYFLLLKDEAARFGNDSDLWMQLVRYGMYNERNGQVDALVAAHLKFDPAKAAKSLKPVLLILAMNRGDAAAAKRIYDGAFEPTERTDPAWFYACYLVSWGRPKEAIETIRGIAPASPELVPRMYALETYLIVASGDVKEGRKRLARPPTDLVEKAFHGLAWALLGDWKRAEPLLADQALYRDWTFMFLQEYATRTLDARYRATGRSALARDLAFAAATSQPGHPLYVRYAYAPKPGIAQYAGTTSLDGGTVDDRDPNVAGTTTFTVTPQGALAGLFRPKTGDPAKLVGTVDAYGNLRGSAVYHGRKYRLDAKIAPPALYRSYPKLVKGGQFFQLVDAEGFRVLLVGRPKG